METETKSERAVLYLLNIFEPDVDLPCELVPDFVLRRASDLERKYISAYMSRSGTAPDNSARLYESRIFFSGGGLQLSPFGDSEFWRYYVVEFPSSEDDSLMVEGMPARKLSKFRRAAFISNAHFAWGFASEIHPKVINYPQHWAPLLIQPFEYYLRAKLKHNQVLPVLNRSHLQDIVKIYDGLEKLSEAQENIKQACELYRESYALHVTSSFRVLALFAVIEMLLTHDPKDATDSLTRQIKGKVSLLNNWFFDSRFDVEKLFPEAGKKLWNILYDYRSAIAHGAIIDFNDKKKHKSLSSREYVFFFLDEFVRQLLRQAVLKPGLCMDLKEY